MIRTKRNIVRTSCTSLFQGRDNCFIFSGSGIIFSSFRIGIGMDASITPLRHSGLSLVQTTDFFYPLVEDPYMQGKIACANVLSDLYAMGVTECDNMLMLLAVSTKMTEKERDVVVPLIMRGFKV